MGIGQIPLQALDGLDLGLKSRCTHKNMHAPIPTHKLVFIIVECAHLTQTWHTHSFLDLAVTDMRIIVAVYIAVTFQ